MKTYTIRITRQAREQLRGIKKYITEVLFAPDAARNTVAAIKKEIISLDKMPDRIKLTEEEPWRSEGVHRMRVKNYYVYFWIDEENRFVLILPDYLKHITDEKPITARQCVKALAQVGLARPQYIPQILSALRSADLSKYKDSMRPLIERDMEETEKILMNSNLSG